jgi:hypothetical protein
VIIKGTSTRTAFILGAGASRGAVAHVVFKRKRLRAPLNADFFKVLETYARAQGATSADTRRLNRLKRIFRGDLPIKWPPPMEAAFSLLYTAKDFPEIYASRPGRKPRAGERQELDDFLSLLFDVLNALDRDSPTPNGYDRLVGALEDGDTVISLNYDTLIDSALARAGWNPHSGYSLAGGTGKVKWKVKNRADGSAVSKVRLLKLHGSLNWWVRGNRSSLANVFSKKPVLVSAPRTNERAGMIRQIIPPIYGKVFGHAHWRTLWKAAFASLAEVDQLVVVGCSIVDTDYHLQALLRRAVKERKKRGKRLEAILVDRVRIRRRWQKVLRGASARYHSYNTLEKFLTDGLGV